MALQKLPPARWPAVLQNRSNDEFVPPKPSNALRRAGAAFAELAPEAAKKLDWPIGRYLASSCATAASLHVIDASAGGGHFDVARSSAFDEDEARARLGGPDPVVDVQTHYVSTRGRSTRGARGVLQFIEQVAPDRFSGLLGDANGLSLLDFLRCVFVESETRIAVLTAAPGEPADNILPNEEIQATRVLFDRFAGSPRLLHHAIVHPNLPGELDRIGAIAERHRPAGFKVYTLFSGPADRGWRLDDERVGLPFLERARAAGVDVICAHKGLSALAPTGSPEDIGPAAAAFPDLRFLVYHSGYEVPAPGEEEGAYDGRSPLRGTDRLIASLEAAGVGPGANVYAELGSTWYCLVSRPEEAAHVVGKLLLAVGEDNVLWGTDSPWYGPAQPLIDAFRAFEIPEALCEAHGYPPLTAERRRKILCDNACRVYGIDRAQLVASGSQDDLDWIGDVLREAQRVGLWEE